jgi:hypothetical protein
MSARGPDQLTEVQCGQGGLHRAFGKSGFIGQQAQAAIDRSPALASGTPEKIKIDKECRRFLIVSDNIAHEHIQNVIIDWHSLMKAWHACILETIPINGQHFLHRNDP